jgi:3-hydroxyacyl-CoA dehydrogenase
MVSGTLKKNLLVLGSGKMARNIGSFFLQKGYAVTWLVSGKGRASDLEKHLGKLVRRLVRVHGVDKADYQARCGVLGDVQIEKPNLIIECVQEDLEKKKEVFGKVAPVIDEQTIVLTNSSSIVPEKIRDNLAGVHFFYPVELIDFVEVVFPSTFRSETKQRIVRLLHEIGLQYMLQEGKNSFVTNRLLLPLESELFKTLADGYLPEEVNACSFSALLPIGQLAFMDAVGLDIIYASICNYAERMESDEASSYALLRSKLGEIVGSGKTGNKSKNGLLCGERVHWSEEQKSLSPTEREALQTKYLHLFINTCLRFLERENVKQTSLDTILATVFQSEIGFVEALQKEDPDRVYKTMENYYRETGCSYFQPSGLLRRLT